MFPLGLLSGFGIDTATEIAMFGLSAAQTAMGASVTAIPVFAVLFCAGIVLVDTIDGVVMLPTNGPSSGRRERCITT
jgi:high-affinity nickel-transport protein